MARVVKRGLIQAMNVKPASLDLDLIEDVGGQRQFIRDSRSETCEARANL